MPFTSVETQRCDVLVIGGGGAGLRSAIAAAEKGADVLMVSKATIGHATNTYLSKAIIASSGWGDPNDGSRVHGRDTLLGGRNLNNSGMVARFSETIPSETARLQAWGVRFISGQDGKPSVIKIPGHSYARHLVGMNWKGSELIRPLKKKAADSGVRFLEKNHVASLLLSGGRVCGAACVSGKGEFTAVSAGAVVLATGGYGHLYMNTNNAPGITGDGHALAYLAGVPLQDMEFVQYYPTCLGKRGSRILLYERILAQDGVVIRNSRGEDILRKHGYSVPDEITRDQLARVIMTEILEDPDRTGTVAMDLNGLSAEAAKPLAGLLPARWSEGPRVFQVTPTTHFCMGGVVVDSRGETALAGLFAAGEVTAGAHGANRLGGNALAEVIAMGGIVGAAAADAQAAGSADGGASEAAAVRKELGALFGNKGPDPRRLVGELKHLMWLNAGIVRNRQSLARALERIVAWQDAAASVETPKDLIRFLEFRNMRMIGEMVCRAALARTESRGAHFRSDYPDENDAQWRVNLRLRSTDDGMVLDRVQVQ